MGALKYEGIWIFFSIVIGAGAFFFVKKRLNEGRWRDQIHRDRAAARARAAIAGQPIPLQSILVAAPQGESEDAQGQAEDAEPQIPLQTILREAPEEEDQRDPPPRYDQIGPAPPPGYERRRRRNTGPAAVASVLAQDNTDARGDPGGNGSVSSASLSEMERGAREHEGAQQRDTDRDRLGGEGDSTVAEQGSMQSTPESVLRARLPAREEVGEGGSVHMASTTALAFTSTENLGLGNRQERGDGNEDGEEGK